MDAPQHPSPLPHVVTSVTVTDIQMPFGSMVAFMIKWALAAIPAMLVLFIIAGVIVAAAATVIGGLGGLALLAGRSAATAAPADAAGPRQLIVTLRPSLNGWIVQNDEDTDWSTCVLRIGAHTVDIAKLAKHSMAEFAAGAFSAGGLRTSDAVTDADVGIRCASPERQTGRIYLAQR